MKINGNHINNKEELKPKHFLIALGIIGLICYVFYMILSNSHESIKLRNQVLEREGKRIIGFYSINASRPGAQNYLFTFEVAGEKYNASIGKKFHANMAPFNELPVIIAFDAMNPNKNVILPNEKFNYKGYQIKWIYEEKSKRYLLKYSSFPGGN
ncbi:MAG: hypothetical protein N4A71_10580 [Carboxylicivirga sp.]|jgi:hypothetical protein|nr:hypothetical protein [Carboxylicivirga sp.]